MMIEPENNETTRRLFAAVSQMVDPDILRAIQMHEDGTPWAGIAEEIGSPTARAAEQRVRRAIRRVEKKLGSNWGKRQQKP